jgi:hypothetical protein
VPAKPGEFGRSYCSRKARNRFDAKICISIETQQQALWLRPGYAEAMAQLSHALSRIGKLHEAIAVAESAIDCRPDDAAINRLAYLRSLAVRRDKLFD